MKKAAVITGSAGGIGRALVGAFAADGYRVIAVDSADSGELPSGAVFVKADLSALCEDEDALGEFRAAVEAAGEGAKVAVLVNNAATQRLGKAAELSLADIAQTMRVNLIAPMALVKAFLPALEETRGTVINIGSVHAVATKPGFAAYAASKAGLHGLGRALAVDLGPKVQVVTLAPAAVATPMLEAGFEGRADAFAALEAVHPAGRIATPGEIAALALHLTTEAAGFLTGTVVYADGGVLSRLHDPL